MITAPSRGRAGGQQGTAGGDHRRCSGVAVGSRTWRRGLEAAGRGLPPAISGPVTRSLVTRSALIIELMAMQGTGKKSVMQI